MTTPSTRPSSRPLPDKAPGVSFLAAPSFALMRELGLVDEASARNGVWNEQPLLWLLRVLTGARISRCGSACWTYGRIDRRRHGRCHRAGVRTGNTGRAFRRDGLRTRARSRTGFGCFVAVWNGTIGKRNAWLSQAVCGGLACVVEYQAAAITAVVFLYVAARGARGALVFAWSPARCARARALQRRGLRFASSPVVSVCGIRAFCGAAGEGTLRDRNPRSGRACERFDVETRSLVESPVLVLAAIGLAHLWRKGARSEAAVCAAISLLFLLMDSGYFDPRGVSPGPRFFIPALPFLASAWRAPLSVGEG